MRKCIVILLFCGVTVQAESLAESLAARSKKLLMASFAAVTAAEAADSASSWGKLESNPVLGQSSFGIGKASAKIGVVSAVLAGEYLVLRHRRPSVYKAMTVVNFAGAAALGGIAYRNSQIAPLPK
ncbi:MAG: hypothetical protein ABSG65_06900 [Bryobacteraceae bacterium]